MPTAQPKPVPNPPTVYDQIATIEGEIEKLQAHRDQLNQRRNQSFTDIKAAGEAMAKAQQDAVLSGSGASYATARKAFDKLADEDVLLHQELKNMDEGINARRVELNRLRSQLRRVEQAGAKRWLGQHAAQIEAQFTQALARYAAMKNIQTGINPKPEAIVANLMRDSGTYAAMYTETKAQFKQEVSA